MKTTVPPPGTVAGMAGAGPPTRERPPDPPHVNGAAVTPVASPPPVLVTVSVKRYGPPTQPGDVTASAAASDEPDWTVVDAPATPRTGVAAQVSPAAVAVNATRPAPAAENVHTKVCEPAGPIVRGPAGDGPLSSSTSAAPGPAATAGRMFRTSSPPVFVTVSVTVKTWPTETVRAEDASATSTPGASTVNGEAITSAAAVIPVLASVPVTVVEIVTGPANDPVKV